jgi:hypothetical protein
VLESATRFLESLEPISVAIGCLAGAAALLALLALFGAFSSPVIYVRASWADRQRDARGRFVGKRGARS